MNDCEYDVEKKYQEELIKKYLRILSPREQTIIKMSFGMYDDKGLKRQFTPKEIGDKLGLTQERVRQLIDSSIAKMREMHMRTSNSYAV